MWHWPYPEKIYLANKKSGIPDKSGRFSSMNIRRMAMREIPIGSLAGIDPWETVHEARTLLMCYALPLPLPLLNENLTLLSAW